MMLTTQGDKPNKLQSAELLKGISSQTFFDTFGAFAPKALLWKFVVPSNCGERC